MNPGAWFEQREGSLMLNVHVQPGASRTEVAGLHGDCLKIRLAARAIDGEANACLVGFIAQCLGVARRSVSIDRGTTSCRKQVSVVSPRLGPEALWKG